MWHEEKSLIILDQMINFKTALKKGAHKVTWDATLSALLLGLLWWMGIKDTYVNSSTIGGYK